jgi:hypothetical protein
MRFGFRKNEARVPADYSAIAEKVRRRRADREEGEKEPEPKAGRPIDVRAYRPEDRLIDLDTQARKLVEDAKDIPREWDSDAPNYHSPPAPGDWLFHSVVIASVLGVLALGGVAMNEWMSTDASLGMLITIGVISILAMGMMRREEACRLIVMHRTAVTIAAVFLALLLTLALLRVFAG